MKLPSIWVFAVAITLLVPVAGSAAVEGVSLDAEGGIIREIRFEGLERTREYVVTRELTSRVGEPAALANLEEDYANLNNIDIFAQITIAGVAEADSVVLTYTFVETFPLLPSISISITDENGLSVGGGLKSLNLGGRDIYASGRLLVGGATTAEFILEDPWVTGNKMGYRVEYAHRERKNKLADFQETANELYLWTRSNIGSIGRGGINLEFLEIRSDTDDATLSTTNIDRVYRIGYSLGLDSRDSWVDTRGGWWNEIKLSRELKIFDSATNFTQFDLDLRRYQRLPWGPSHTLGVFSLLTLRSGTVGETVAPWQQFGMGGTSTVRGWEYASRVGKNQFIGTLEYRITIMKQRRIPLPFGIQYRGGLQVAAFGDAGAVWDEGRDFALNNFIGGGGVGIRLLLPVVSMLRVDVGWGEAGMGARLHIGSLEKAEQARKRVR